MINREALNFLRNKKIALLGLGVENLALVKFLLRRSPAAETAAGQKQIGNPPRPRGAATPPGEGNIHITVCDPKSAAELGDRLLEIKELARKNKLPEIILMTGKDYDKHLADFDIIFRSPGYPLFNPNLLKAKKAGVEISSPMKSFFELCPSKNIIGVTGSKGKGTTSSLIYEIIKSAFAKASADKGGRTTPSPSLGRRGIFLGGNIGTAPFEFIDKIKPKDWVVLELSSFQLEDLEMSPHIAVVTNLFKEHLAPADPHNPNYHRSMKDYWTAKANIFKYQKKNDWLVINEQLKNKKEKIKNLGKIIYYGKSALPNNLIGEHNRENVAAAVAVAKILKIKPEIIAKAVKNFKGLPHRLEFVAEINGVRYFDDSFATVPDVSVIALKSFGDMTYTPRPRAARVHPSQEGNIILLAGGADKGSDFEKFAKEIRKKVKYLILFRGKGTERLKEKLKNKKEKIPIIEVNDMKRAVKIAEQESELGDIVLLSAGCASFGCFKNYKERGDQFKKEVTSILKT
ncbi:MAG TPA: UDP-N-acetylmuramoyl-L-alanine--D-glutamate ligase [Candidatus Nanoarchaeia archaeon]|nr:UDP-N-acetylmuramoyl-L-alanine--D-glutamate ligase [Candidatus Nanoarchaeia archaeon]